MKRNRFLQLLIILYGSMSVSACAAEGWEDLPQLVFKESVEVETVIAQNPYSDMSNDFLVVTKYEEGEKGGSAGRGVKDGSHAPKSLNVYLVTALLLMDGGQIGLPYHSSLIVSVRSGSGSPGQVIQQWLLSDSDGDGELDEAVFQKITTGAEGSSVRSDPVEVPQEQVRKYQTYYEQASRQLNNKVEVFRSG